MAFHTFHFFPNLPKEIQGFIWNAAVRTVPGTTHVHRFMVLGSQEPDHSSSGHLLDLASFNVTETEHDHLDEHKENEEKSAGEESNLTEKEGVSQKAVSSKTLVPGSCHLTIPYEVLDGDPNYSIYPLDSSLWMACEASRVAMERRFPKNRWWSVTGCENAPERLATCGDYNQENGTAYTASYENYDSEYTHITINHDRDLFCLDSRHLGSLDWLQSLRLCIRRSILDFPACI